MGNRTAFEQAFVNDRVKEILLDIIDRHTLVKKGEVLKRNFFAGPSATLEEIAEEVDRIVKRLERRID